MGLRTRSCRALALAMGKSGSVTVKQLPLPSSDSTEMLPPIKVTKRWTMDSPRPEPPLVLCLTCTKGSKMRVSLSAGMPMPVSDTLMINTQVLLWSGTKRASISRLTAPEGVYLSALASKLMRICRTRRGSATTASGQESLMRKCRLRPFSVAMVRNKVSQLLVRSLRLTGSGVSSKRPASTLLKSKISLIKSSSTWPLWMIALA